MKEKILLVEDEVELSKAVKMILTFENYDVDTAYNGKEAIELVKENVFDVIVMDVMMPIVDGIEALKEMRKIGVNTPVILLTAKSQIDDKVEGLDSGANDYLTKPFNRKELLARIRSLLRTNNEQKQKYSIGNIRFDKGQSEISSEKATFRLNSKECSILEMLIKNQPNSITSNEFERIVWSKEEKVENGVNMYISYLQNKFTALDSNVEIIKKGNEYKLECKV